MKTLTFTLAFLFLPQAPSEPGGTVAGVVVSAGTGKPLQGAEVKLSIADPRSGVRSPNPVATDSNGRFSATGITPGDYGIAAAKGGYATQFYGSRRPGMAGLDDSSVFHVESGKATRDVVIALTPSGTMSGRVYGQAGEPLVGMQVELLRNAFDVSGRRNLESLLSTTTNDRGDYRFFDFSPGRYYLRVRWALMVMVKSGEVVSGFTLVDARTSNGQGYAGAFYPGSPDLEHASLIDVRPGTEHVGLNLYLRRAVSQSSRKVRIRVCDSETGQPPPGEVSGSFGVTSRSEGYPASDGFSVGIYDQRLSPDGSFEIDVPDGRYWLAGKMADRIGIRPMDVAEGDQGIIVLTLAPTETISGRVSLDGQPWFPPSSEGFEIRLRPDPSVRVGNEWPSPSSIPLKPDGTFSITGLGPEEYRMDFAGLPADAYVREARYGGIDLLTEKVSFHNLRSGSLDVAVSTKSGEVTGRVVDANDSPAVKVEAVLIPDFPLRRPDRYKTAKTDANGRFSISGIAPGDYKLYSWENIARFGYLDTDFVRQFEGRGLSIHIDEGSRLTADLSLLVEP